MPNLSGKIVFSSGKVGEAQVWLANLNSSLCRRISDESGNCVQPTLSPGGVRVAYICEDANGAMLHVADLQDEAIRITAYANPTCSVKSPTFDPTGKRIAYLSAHGQSIWIQDLDSGICERLCCDLLPTHSLRWSLQGSLFGASTNADGNTENWEYAINPTRCNQLSTETALDVGITPAPEQSVIAFLSDRQLRSVHTRSVQRSTGNARLLSRQNWTRRQAFRQGLDIWVMNSSGELPVKVTDNGQCARSLAWSADSSQLLYATESQDQTIQFGVLPMSDLVQAYQRNNKAAIINAADQLRSLSRERRPCCFNESSLAELRHAKNFDWVSGVPTTAVQKQQSFDSIPVLPNSSSSSVLQID
ncbi:MAG: TolB family protein [Pirellulaceae bacterium]